ncbi:MAG: NnrU family protein [Ectothiorhodospiraceae bacterium]|jgi:uncharacterized membrane protein
MGVLIAGLVLFFMAHSVSIAAPRWRDGMVAQLGEGPWKGAYSLVSAVGLVLIVWGYGMARQDPVFLYVPPFWLRHVTMLLMVFVFPLLLAAYLPGRIRSAVKHPMLVAVKTWALAHLLVNGTLADLLLFGAFLAWAVADRISLKRRAPRPAPTLPATALNDVIAVVGGLVIYGLFVVYLHRWLIGVPIIS